jgi:hypothetical protein
VRQTRLVNLSKGECGSGAACRFGNGPRPLVYIACRIGLPAKTTKSTGGKQPTATAKFWSPLALRPPLRSLLVFLPAIIINTGLVQVKFGAPSQPGACIFSFLWVLLALDSVVTGPSLVTHHHRRHLAETPITAANQVAKAPVPDATTASPTSTPTPHTQHRPVQPTETAHHGVRPRRLHGG